MKIKSLSTEKFRSFNQKIRLDNIKHVSVFVGANNAGKSNIFEILSCLRELANSRWSKPYSDLAFDNHKKFNIEIELELSDDERRDIIEKIPTPNVLESIMDNFSNNKIFQFLKYHTEISEKRCLKEHLYLSDKNGNYVEILYFLYTPSTGRVEATRVHIEGYFHGQKGSIEDFSQLQMGEKTNMADESVGIFVPNGLFRDTVQSKLIVMLRNHLKAIRIFGSHRQANPKYGGDQKWKLMESGQNLIEVMSTILGQNQTKYSEIIKEYNKIISAPIQVNVPPSIEGNYHTLKLNESGLSNETDFQNISTGLHEALILVLAIRYAEPEETLCIEEPEIHLHASAQKKLFNLICTHATNNQILITTHSAIFTDVKKEVNTYLITRSDSGSQITLVENENELRFIKRQLGIRNSDIYGNDYVVFIEGSSEEHAFPIISTQLGYDNIGIGAEKKIRLINLEGNGIIPKLEQFLEYLNNSDVEPFLIADGDKKVSSSVEDYIRKGILKQENVTVWDKEFEDTFDDARIINAMKKLSETKGFQFDLTEEELKVHRDKNKKVADILQKYLNQKNQPDLNKPDLAIQLATDIVNEIKNGASREETPFEKVVKTIFDIIKKHDDSN